MSKRIKLKIELYLEMEMCPFCGGADLELSNTWTPCFWVECRGCGAQAIGESVGEAPDDTTLTHYDSTDTAPDVPLHRMPENYQRAAASAVRAWNRRAS